MTALWTRVICPKDGRDVTGGWHNRPGSIKARAVEPASAFFIQQPLLCVCLSISVVSLIWCCLSFTSTQNKIHDGYKCNKTSTWARADYITGCVFLPANELSLLGIHTVSVLSAWEQSKQSQLSRELSPAFLAVPVQLSLRRGGGCARGNRRWIRWRGRRRVSPYLLPFPIRSNCPLSRFGSPLCGSSPRRVGSTLRLPSSEEVDVEDVDEHCFISMLWTRKRSLCCQPIGK